MYKELSEFLGNQFYTVVFRRRNRTQKQNDIRVMNARNNVKKYNNIRLTFNPVQKNLFVTTDVKLKNLLVGIFEQDKLVKKILTNSIKRVTIKENQEARILEVKTPVRMFSTDWRLIEVRAHGKVFKRNELLKELRVNG